MAAIKQALISVSDKSGILEFAQGLDQQGVKILSTGGTAKLLADNGIPVTEVADYTGFPEMLDGRVKTLHPGVHGGILHRRDHPDHVAAVAEHGIAPIDMVVVNLYAFEKTAARAGVTTAELIENIDIGGPSMLRSAAKNFTDVAVVSNAADYPALTEELHANAGQLSLETRWRLARAAFATTAAYDSAIATTLETLPSEPKLSTAETSLPPVLRISAKLKNSLRYGENPHQAAAVYTDGSKNGIANAEQLQGKELSYNNLVDLDACWSMVNEFEQTAVVIVKHTNPCGVALGNTVEQAYIRALEADPVSAFGGVIGVNRVVDGPAATAMAKLFVEAIVAPGFTPEALTALSTKKNLRVLRIEPIAPAKVIKQISGGFLLQDEDRAVVTAETLTCPTARKPTTEEMAVLLFAWKVCKHVKSNAIVYARLQEGFGQTVGMGAGQMSRVDAARFGAMKAALPLAGTVAASDAFFPFPDGLEVIANAGATAIIQPGGSVRDAEVIAAADRLGIAMVFTGIRHFRHG